MGLAATYPSFSGIDATEVGYLDGVTPGTSIASKAVVLDSGGDFIHIDGHSTFYGTGSDVEIRWDGTDLDILGIANNQVIKVGNGTNSFDLWVYGAAAGDTIVFDASANMLTLDGVDLTLKDADFLIFGDAADVTVAWDGTDLDILALADDQVIKFGNGTNSFDIWIYGNTASDRIVFDASAMVMDFDGIDLQLKDADILHFGDTIADDARIVFDGTRLVITPLTVGGVVHIGDSADSTGNQVHVFDGGADDPGLVVLYDAAGVAWYMWIDTTGDLRIHTAAPTNEDGDGTIVGTQS